MTLTKLRLFQYSIDLDSLLPVGKQRIDARTGLVLEVIGHERSEFVEISPLSGLDINGAPLVGFSAESLDDVSRALQSLLPKLLNQPIDHLLDAAVSESQPSIAYGLSLLHAKLSGQLDGHSTSKRSIPLIYRACDEPIELLHARVRDLPAEILAVKIKVAQTSLEEEIQLIHEILAIRPDLKLRLDANRGFELEQAIEFAACLPINAIEYIEEPCRQPQDNVAFFEAIEMPWALDETLNDPGYQFEMRPGLTALIIKPMLFGSLEKLQDLQQQASEFGVRCILSSSLEASLGIEALRNLSQIMTPDEIPGLDTLTAFSSDLIIGTGKKQCLSTHRLTLIQSIE